MTNVLQPTLDDLWTESRKSGEALDRMAALADQPIRRKVPPAPWLHAVADYELDLEGGNVVLRCQVGDCAWNAEPAAIAGSCTPQLWDPNLMQLWTDHLRRVHPGCPKRS
jgi:hypothetical protein